MFVTMKTVGLFPELEPGSAEPHASIHDAAGALLHSVARTVRHYLDSGIPVYGVPEATRDPLDRSKFIPGGSSLVTDGEWIWRNDLAYFVERYRVGLPEAFIQKACGKRTVSADREAITPCVDEILKACGRASGDRQPSN